MVSSQCDESQSQYDEKVKNEEKLPKWCILRTEESSVAIFYINILHNLYRVSTKASYKQIPFFPKNWVSISLCRGDGLISLKFQLVDKTCNTKCTRKYILHNVLRVSTAAFYKQRHFSPKNWISESLCRGDGLCLTKSNC
jgi:hypothetical protein